MAKGLHLLTMGKKNVLRGVGAGFQAFSFDNKVYGSYLMFVETPARRGFAGACTLSSTSVALKALIERQRGAVRETSGMFWTFIFLHLMSACKKTAHKIISRIILIFAWQWYLVQEKSLSVALCWKRY